MLRTVSLFFESALRLGGCLTIVVGLLTATAVCADEGWIATPRPKTQIPKPKAKLAVDPFAASPFDDANAAPAQKSDATKSSDSWKAAPRLTLPKPGRKSGLVDVPTPSPKPPVAMPAVPKAIEPPKLPATLAPAPTKAPRAIPDEALPLISKKPLPLPPTTPDSRVDRAPTDNSAEPPTIVNAVADASIYRPLAAVVAEGERERGARNDLEWAAMTLPAKPQTPPPVMLEQPGLPTTIEEQVDLAPALRVGESSLSVAPGSTLWQPPLAQQRAPRTFAKWFGEAGGTLDAGFGGQFGLFRACNAGCEPTAFELDVFAAAFGRFVDTDRLRLLDVRYGVPFVYASGPWRWKFAYEHTSGYRHNGLGLQDIGVPVYRRNDLVVGAAYSFDCRWRVYGEAAGAVELGPEQRGRGRYDLGVEWSALRCTTPAGEPFAAANVEWRAEQDHTANVTLQLGWHWRALAPGRGPRIALEYYNGKSPFGGDFQTDENWVAAIAAWDW